MQLYVRSKERKGTETLNTSHCILLTRKDCRSMFKTWNTKNSKHSETVQGCKQHYKARVWPWVESLSLREPPVTPRCVMACSLPWLLMCPSKAWLSGNNGRMMVLQIELFPSSAVSSAAQDLPAQESSSWGSSSYGAGALICHCSALASSTPVQIKASTRAEHHHPHMVAFYSHFA